MQGTHPSYGIYNMVCSILIFHRFTIADFVPNGGQAVIVCV